MRAVGIKQRAGLFLIKSPTPPVRGRRRPVGAKAETVKQKMLGKDLFKGCGRSPRERGEGGAAQ